MSTSGLMLTLAAGGFTLAGVALKAAYDSYVTHRSSARRDIEWMAPERRAAYERLLAAIRAEREFWTAMHDLAEEHKSGLNEISDEVLDAQPRTAMKELVESIEEVRRLARTYAVISAAEAVVRLFIDMASALRQSITTPGPNDDIAWFLLLRFMEDREMEFVHAYRADLGLGAPTGAPPNYPLPSRPWPAESAEALLRSHLRQHRTKE